MTPQNVKRESRKKGDVVAFVNLRRFIMREVQGSRSFQMRNAKCGMRNDTAKREA